MIVVVDTFPGGDLKIATRKGTIEGTVEVTLRFAPSASSGGEWSAVVLTVRPEQAAQIARALQEVVEYAGTKEVA